MSNEAKLAEYLERVHKLVPVIRAHAGESERSAQLAAPVVDAFHDAGLFRIWLPPEVEGAGLTIGEGLRLFEETARADGSAGWNLAIGASTGLVTNFISRAAFEKIFGDRRALIAGSLNPTARAVKTTGGWRFSGRSTYASGCSQATWFTASGIVVEDGKPQLANGVPVFRVGIFPMRECQILKTWSVSGMRGTGSHDCVFEDVLVPQDFTYSFPDPEPTWKHGPFSSIPLASQLGGTLASVALGVAQHAIDALKKLAVGKVPTATMTLLRDRPLAQIQLAQAEGLLRAARSYLYKSNDDAWRKGERGEPFDNTERAGIRLAGVTATKLAAQAVDLVYDAAGISAIQTSEDIERCWRDAHTITQHVMVSSGRYEVVGRVLFGLDAGSPII